MDHLWVSLRLPCAHLSPVFWSISCTTPSCMSLPLRPSHYITKVTISNSCLPTTKNLEHCWGWKTERFFTSAVNIIELLILGLGLINGFPYLLCIHSWTILIILSVSMLISVINCDIIQFKSHSKYTYTFSCSFQNINWVPRFDEPLVGWCDYDLFLNLRPLL